MMLDRQTLTKQAVVQARSMENHGPAIGLVAHLAIVLTLLTSNFLLRCYLDQAGSHITSFLKANYPEKLQEIYALAWWQYFLPIKTITGAWQATSILLVHRLELLFGEPARVFYFTNAVLVTTCYVLSWSLFRSLVFSITFTLCFAWSTFNHHVYLVSGSVALPLIISYLLCFLFCQFKLMQPSCEYRIWIPLGLFSMLIYAFSYEAWLDCVCWMWVGYPFLIAFAYRSGDRERATRGALLLASVTVAAIGYVVIKTKLGYGQGPGSESEIVFNYGVRRAVVGVEDVIVHWFTLVYMAISPYLPPYFFSGSVSAWLYGTNELMALQNGYHEQKVHLVGYSHLFLWRFYAGFAAAVLLYVFWRVVHSAWQRPGKTNIALFIFISMILMPGATHILVKYRPMHSVPFLHYHSYFGVVGSTLLVGFVAMWVHDNFEKRRLAWILIALIWFDVGVCVLARPSFLSYMAVEGGFAPYPDAWANLKDIVRKSIYAVRTKAGSA